MQKDGLTSLAELLSKWEDQVETEQGVLLILKVRTRTRADWLFLIMAD